MTRRWQQLMGLRPQFLPDRDEMQCEVNQVIEGVRRLPHREFVSDAPATAGGGPDAASHCCFL